MSMEIFDNSSPKFRQMLMAFLESKGLKLIRYPIIGGVELDFFYLYKFVPKRGGFNVPCFLLM